MRGSCSSTLGRLQQRKFRCSVSTFRRHNGNGSHQNHWHGIGNPHSITHFSQLRIGVQTRVFNLRGFVLQPLGWPLFSILFFLFFSFTKNREWLLALYLFSRDSTIFRYCIKCLASTPYGLFLLLTLSTYIYRYLGVWRRWQREAVKMSDGSLQRPSGALVAE
jgi:hypothetical protein